MDRRWTSHLKDNEEKDNFRATIQGSVAVIDRLRDILKAELRDNIAQQVKLEQYSRSSWSQYQADCIGTQRTLRMVIDLLPKEK